MVFRTVICLRLLNEQFGNKFQNAGDFCTLVVKINSGFTVWKRMPLLFFFILICFAVLIILMSLLQFHILFNPQLIGRDDKSLVLLGSLAHLTYWEYIWFICTRSRGATTAVYPSLHEIDFSLCEAIPWHYVHT